MHMVSMKPHAPQFGETRVAQPSCGIRVACTMLAVHALIHGPGREILRFIGKKFTGPISKYVYVKVKVTKLQISPGRVRTRCARNITYAMCFQNNWFMYPKTSTKLPPYYRLSSSWAGPETMIHGATSVRIVAFGERGHTGGA